MTTRKLYQYRILFADDQPEVARTLAGLFRTTEIKVDFAVDGQEALVMCQRTRYDLVIVDLQMPPERWGGLWFIRKLSERMYRVPVLVLSGAAGQAETIEALHLKAKGFVVKDRAQYELREKVTAMLAEGRSEVRTLAMQTLPTPIAVQCSRMDSADSPVQRLYLTLSALEYALRVTCIIAVAEARMDGGADAQKFLYDVSPYIIAPAMGTSNAARRMAASMLPGSMGAGLASQFDDRLTNEAIAIRNEIAHVQMPSEVAGLASQSVAVSSSRKKPRSRLAPWKLAVTTPSTATVAPGIGVAEPGPCTSWINVIGMTETATVQVAVCGETSLFAHWMVTL